MDLERLRDYLLSRPAATEDMPFGPDVLAFRIGGKIFALVNLERIPLSVNLKCEPGRATELRDQFEEVRPGYHMNKTHWNTVDLEGSLGDGLIRGMADHSYQRVLDSLPASVRDQLGTG